MANLAAMDLVKLLPWASLKVYTVGAPRVGNHAYARDYNRLVPDSWAIINYRVSYQWHACPCHDNANTPFLHPRLHQFVACYMIGNIERA